MALTNYITINQPFASFFVDGIAVITPAKLKKQKRLC